MDIGGLDVVVHQVFRQFLCHALGEGGDQHTLPTVTACQDLVHQVVNLVLALAHLYLWIQQPRRTDHLFHHNALCLSQFVVGRGGTHVDHLVDHLVELLEGQRTVVEGRRQTESVLHEVGLTGPVAAIHRIDLWHAHMTLVDNQQIVFREEVEQAIGPFSCLAPVEVAAIVLNARAMPQFLDHLHIVLHPFLDALCLDAVA